MDRRARVQVGVGTVAAVGIALLVAVDASASSEGAGRDVGSNEPAAVAAPPTIGNLEVCIEGANARARAFIEGPVSLVIREIRENKRFECITSKVPAGPYTVGVEEPKGACKMVSLDKMTVQRLGNRYRPVPLLPQLLTYVVPEQRTTVTFTFTCSPRLPAGTILLGLIPKAPPGAPPGGAQPGGAPAATPPR